MSAYPRTLELLYQKIYVVFLNTISGPTVATVSLPHLKLLHPQCYYLPWETEKQSTGVASNGTMFIQVTRMSASLHGNVDTDRYHNVLKILLYSL